MSPSNTEEVNTSMTGDVTHSVASHEVVDVGNAAASSNVPISSEKVALQFKVTTDPLTKQLEKLCDIMKELGRDTSRRSEETSGLIQGPSRPRGHRFDRDVYCDLVIYATPKTQSLFYVVTTRTEIACILRVEVETLPKKLRTLESSEISH